MAPDAHGPDLPDSMVGVSFFSNEDTVDFGRFDRATLALFQLLSGDTWCDALPEVRGRAANLSPEKAQTSSRRKLRVRVRVHAARRTTYLGTNAQVSSGA